MMKRNDGYTLAYVMVVLFVLASVALATMGLALQPAKNQAASQQRMQDKYAAQGLAEQVVARLEHADAEKLAAVLEEYKDNTQPVYCVSVPESDPVSYILTAKSGKTTVTAEFTLEPIPDKKEPETGSPPVGGTTDETENPPAVTPEPVIIGHTVKYISYKTEVAQ